MLDDFSDKDRKSFIRQIYEGGIIATALNRGLAKKLYLLTGKKLVEAIKIGFNGDVDMALYRELKDNIYMFSAAKTYTQIKDISSFLLDGKKVRPYSEFKKLARERFDIYNVRYLKTEYNTAITAAQNSLKWQAIEREAISQPYVEYKAVMDETTCNICRPLNGLVFKVGDSKLNIFYPPNHFDCKCIMIQHSEATVTSQQDLRQITGPVEKKMAPVFKSNCGKDRVIYNSDHPYFDVEPKDKKLASRNFNLPIP